MNLKEGLSVGVTAIASEHWFSSLLSSPITSSRFFKWEEILPYLLLASGISIGFGCVMDYLTGAKCGKWTGLGIALFVSTVYYFSMRR